MKIEINCVDLIVGYGLFAFIIFAIVAFGLCVYDSKNKEKDDVCQIELKTKLLVRQLNNR